MNIQSAGSPCRTNASPAWRKTSCTWLRNHSIWSSGKSKNASARRNSVELIKHQAFLLLLKLGVTLLDGTSSSQFFSCVFSLNTFSRYLILHAVLGLPKIWRKAKSILGAMGVYEK